MNQTKTELLLQFILAAAAGEDDYQDRDLGPIHLVKYAYIADLAFFSSTGETFTGVSWRFHKFGPWARDVYERIEPALHSIGAEKKQIPSKYSDKDFTRWHLSDPELVRNLDRQLPHPVASAVKRAVHKYTNDTPSLLHDVYLTEPMLRAAPGEYLDLNIKQPLYSKDQSTGEQVQPISKTAAKKRKEKHNELKNKIREKLVSSKAKEKKFKKYTPPRYDELFMAGQEWVDLLAGQVLEPQSGIVSFSPDIWKSPSRYDPDVS